MAAAHGIIHIEELGDMCEDGITETKDEIVLTGDGSGDDLSREDSSGNHVQLSSGSIIEYSSLGLSGLENMGNTCFMNSAIQALTNTKMFLSYLIHEDSCIMKDVVSVIKREKSDLSDGMTDMKIKDTIIYNLSRLVKCMWSSNKKIRPRTFKKVSDKLMTIFEGHQQHDSQEFLSILMNRIDDELNVTREFDFIVSDLQISMKYNIEKLKNEFHEKDNYRDKVISYLKKHIKSIDKFKEDHANYELEYEYERLVKVKIQLDERVEAIDNQLFDIVTELKSLYEESPRDYMYVDGMLTLKKNLNGKLSVINEIFSGSYVNTFTCKTCGNQQYKFDRFDTLPLHLPDLDEEYTRKDYDISDLLTLYTNVDTTEKHCYFCKGRCPFTTQIKLYTLSPTMIIMIKKYRQIEDSYFRSDEKIVYGHELDLTKFMHEYSPQEDKVMNLTSSIRHHGRMSGGHYFAYGKNFMSGKWHRFDDDDVYECDSKEVLESNSYVLFYDQ
jgi:ubiquitin C-terminal hydrolase